VTFSGTDGPLCECNDVGGGQSISFQSLNLDGSYVVPLFSETATTVTYILEDTESGIELDYTIHDEASCSDEGTSYTQGYRLILQIEKATGRISTLTVVWQPSGDGQFPVPTVFSESPVCACLGDSIPNTRSCAGIVSTTTGAAVASLVP